MSKPEKGDKGAEHRGSLSRRNIVAAAVALGAVLTAVVDKAVAHGRDRDRDDDRGGGGGRGGGKGGGGDARCFLAGTRILTPSGEVEISTLEAGDLVVTVGARAEPIRAIRSYMFGTQELAAHLRPVRIARGALGHDSPSSDLYLSQWHSLYVDGVLIPVIDLVNDGSIQIIEPQGDAIRYFEVELAHHDVLIAEGALCESLRDEHATPAMQPFAPIVRIKGRKGVLMSRLRSAVSPVVDLRTHQDVIRDRLEARSLRLPRAA